MLKELVSSFGMVKDPRVSWKSGHRLVDILVISVCAVLAHAESFEDIALYGRSKHDWLSQFLLLPHGIPSHDTFRRVFMLIAPTQFERCFLHWVRQVFVVPAPGVFHQIAVDGKTVRRSFDRRQELSPLHVVSAFSTHSGLTLGQCVVPEKSGEIKALPALFEGLDLSGALVSLDALHCKTEIAQTIIDRKGDYLMALKGNQKTALSEVNAYFTQKAFQAPLLLPPAHDAFDKTHGRLVRRRAFVSDELDHMPTLKRWTGIKKVIAVESIRSINNSSGKERGKVTSEIRYFLTSSTMADEMLVDAVRKHWGIENSLHWVLDMGFREDECRIRNRNAAANLTILRKIAINLVNADKSVKGSIKGKRKAAAWNDSYMKTLINLT